MHQKRLAIFASGRGSNALNIIDYFKDHPVAHIAFVLSNRTDAPVLDLADAKNVPTVAMNNEEVADGKLLAAYCLKEKIDYIILAGYLRKIPVELIAAFPGRILNIHPSLLPKFGGKGMYGAHVHTAVLTSGEHESGITIHRVDEEFDRGEILAQYRCDVSPEDTIETLQEKIQYLEHRYFPEVIAKTIAS